MRVELTARVFLDVFSATGVLLVTIFVVELGVMGPTGSSSVSPSLCPLPDAAREETRSSLAAPSPASKNVFAIRVLLFDILPFRFRFLQVHFFIPDARARRSVLVFRNVPFFIIFLFFLRLRYRF
jgi:hypothetical protein